MLPITKYFFPHKTKDVPIEKQTLYSFFHCMFATIELSIWLYLGYRLINLPLKEVSILQSSYEPMSGPTFRRDVLHNHCIPCHRGHLKSACLWWYGCQACRPPSLIEKSIYCVYSTLARIFHSILVHYLFAFLAVVSFLVFVQPDCSFIQRPMEEFFIACKRGWEAIKNGDAPTIDEEQIEVEKNEKLIREQCQRKTFLETFKATSEGFSSELTPKDIMKRKTALDAMYPAAGAFQCDDEYERLMQFLWGFKGTPEMCPPEIREFL